MVRDVIPGSVLYRERLLPSVAGWLPSFLLIPAVYFVLIPISTSQVAVGSALVAFALAVLAIVTSSARIELTRDVLSVGTARIPLTVISGAEAIAKVDAFAERGSNLDARAYIRFAMTVPTLCKVYLADANDVTPYWLFSTRNPEQLAALLTELIAGAKQSRPKKK